MPDVFGSEGPGPDKKPGDKKPGPGKKPVSRGEPDVLHGSMDPRAAEAKAGRYAVYDNDSGEILLRLPRRFAKYRRELEEELLDAFMGEPVGSAQGQSSLDAWIKAWIEQKTKEDPDLAQPDADRDA